MRPLLPLRAGAAALVLASCGGGAKDSSTALSTGSQLLSAGAFAAAVNEPARVTVNVHVPDEGSIEGTDLWVPYDEIAAERSELPDPSTPLAIYCRSGRMSAIVVESLAALGYTDIVELAGGMTAWEAAGRPLLPPGAG